MENEADIFNNNFNVNCHKQSLPFEGKALLVRQIKIRCSDLENATLDALVYFKTL